MTFRRNSPESNACYSEQSSASFAAIGCKSKRAGGLEFNSRESDFSARTNLNGTTFIFHKFVLLRH